MSTGVTSGQEAGVVEVEESNGAGGGGGGGGGGGVAAFWWGVDLAGLAEAYAGLYFPPAAS